MNFFRLLTVVCGLLIATQSTWARLTVPQNASSCNGDFDVYFVLDLSSSLLRGRINHFKEETVSFVKLLVDKFTSPLLRLSFITFNYEANVVMDLTNDRTIVRAKLRKLRQAIPDGMTRLGLGIEKVNDQIKKYGEKRASVAIVLTDGILEYSAKAKAVKESNIARSYGATIIAVGVGKFDPSQLLEIVGGSKKLVFQADSFEGLNRIVKKVIDGSCVEIDSAHPNLVCANSSFQLSIRGKGFNKTGDFKHVKCNFWFNESSSFLINPTSVGPTHLTCPSPKNIRLMPGDVITLQVTLNGGVSFISSNVTISSGVCATSGGVVWAILFIFGLLFAMLLWWFWNVISCAKVEKEQSKPPRPLPPPPPVPPTSVMELQQWPAVDASFYGGRGAGGMHPMKVQWGEKGCTEGAMHLEKTKDAKEVGYVGKEVLVPYQPKAPLNRNNQSTSCCGGFKGGCGFLSSFVTQLSSRRPTTADLSKCIIVKPTTDTTRTRTSNASSTGGYFDTRN